MKFKGNNNNIQNIHKKKKKKMRPHMDNINNPFGYTSAARPTWETARPQPPPRRRANSLQHNVSPTVAAANNRPTRRSLFNTTVVCVPVCLFICLYLSLCVFLFILYDWYKFISSINMYCNIRLHCIACAFIYIFFKFIFITMEHILGTINILFFLKKVKMKST